ncbi:TPA: hypothetical protein DEO28_04095 [Candidatus Dependentiae bacterium]|nr:MAG: ATP-dependent DNA helicase PcrA [candidate division TM6 bacterium GW2011_GWE2_31_21]KKP53521.1 MAG: ATP-dependent DNA helicase PcrA [candidate division TM6 bacterium GW2011_GWF2_33_332]HBS48238.1 hypothetical protein [Candidatus Dependentiae bacterium]HBZ73664.1 hypothetical protein [Candidatus Dependentiae bacterium]
MLSAKLDFNNFLENELNEQQKEAVTHQKGAVLVIAGAGSGKTRVITSRIANLIINENVDPKSITALTFTNKAAGEMKERVAFYLQKKSYTPFVGTFHSFCLNLLRTNPSISPFAQFSILDEDDKTSLLRKLLKSYNLEKQINISQLTGHISSLKNSQLNSDDIKATPPIFQELYSAYEKEKNNIHCLDFDDLLIKILEIFQKNKEFKNKFQEKAKHILVDEYQDTNKIQHLLLQNMVLNDENKLAVDSICAVGDEDQSIYSWRGAVVENMIKFKHDFAPVTIIKIEQNYRTVEPILNAANKVIENNKIRNEKKLWSTKKGKNRILVLENRSDYQEADSITNFINCFLKEKPQNSLAILYRTHFQSRIIEEALIYNKIPYQIIGGIQFYQRKEIKDLLAYMRLVINPFDKISFFRVINTPSRGLGDQFENLVAEEWNNNPFLDFQQILDLVQNKIPQTSKKVASIQEFLLAFKNFTPKSKPSDFLNHVLESTEYLNYIRTFYEGEESLTKTENIKELCRAIENFENQEDKFMENKRNEKDLEEFLAEVSLMEERSSKQNKEANTVKMMTLHAAKGLEFDLIIIIGLEEGLFPSSRSLYTSESLEEERRLFYVGMTRAKEWIILSNAKQRNTFGQLCEQSLSRFVEEIPQNLFEKIITSKDTTYSLQAKFKSFISNIKIDAPKIFFGANKPMDFSSEKKMVPKPIIPPKSNSSNLWRMNQLVSHEKFGVGIVKKIEKKSENQYFLTISFKIGEKKVSSSFLKKI